MHFPKGLPFLIKVLQTYCQHQSLNQILDALKSGTRDLTTGDIDADTIKMNVAFKLPVSTLLTGVNADLSSVGYIGWNPLSEGITGKGSVSTTQYVIAPVTRSHTFITSATAVGAGATWASVSLPMWRVPSSQGITIVGVRGSSIGESPSVSLQIAEAASADLTSTTGIIGTGGLTADANGDVSDDIVSANISANSHIILEVTNAAAGTRFLSVTIDYKLNS